MVVQAPEFEITPLRGTASIAVSISLQQIGLITYEAACGWTAISDDQSRTCETLHEAIDFIKTVWEPGLPPTIPNLARAPAHESGRKKSGQRLGGVHP
jgi:hypothetical protein